MKKRRLLGLLAVLGCSLLLAGCHNPFSGNSSNSKSMAPAPEAVSYEKSESVAADIYLDGTTSMSGYVNYSGGTIYDDAVKELDRTLTKNWKNDSIRYIKFGDTFQEMNRDTFMQMEQVGFYDQKDTSLQKVVDQMDPNKLNILVTDLFQTNQDLDSLIRSIKNKGMGEGKAIAVVGMKSQFNGKIFDVGKNMSSLDYQTTGEEDSYRPFYVLVMGNENDTRVFVKSYQNSLPKNANAATMFLSSNLGIDTKLEEDKASNKKEKGKENAAKMAVLPNLTSSNEVMQYRLKTEDALSTAGVRMYAKDTLGTIPDKYQLKVDRVEKWTDSYTIVKADDFISGTVGDVGLKDGAVNIAFTLDAAPASIKKEKGVYRVEFSLIPDKDSYLKAAGVFDAWNFDDSQINEGEDALAKVGNKTLNISKFSNMLASLNYELNAPGFHHLYAYFNVKE